MSFTSAGCGHRPAVHFSQALYDGKSESDPAILALRRTVRLAEAREQIGEKLRANAVARIANADQHVRIHPLGSHMHRATGIGEFDRVVQQIPNDLLEPAWIAV